MRKKAPKTTQTRYASPDKIPFRELCRAPVEESAFLYYSHLSISAGGLEIPVRSPESYRLSIMDEATGETTDLGFPDNPLNRMMFGLKENMTEEEQDTIMPAVMTRILALMHLIRDKRLEQWVERDDTKRRTRIPEVIFKVAATAAVGNDLEFDWKEFQRTVGKK